MSITDEPLFPVSAITTGTVIDAGCIMIRFDFLASPMQDSSKPNPGRNYLLTPVQARGVAERILSLLPRVENAESQGSGHSKH